MYNKSVIDNLCSTTLEITQKEEKEREEDKLKTAIDIYTKHKKEFSKIELDLYVKTGSIPPHSILFEAALEKQIITEKEKDYLVYAINKKTIDEQCKSLSKSLTNLFLWGAFLFGMYLLIWK